MPRVSLAAGEHYHIFNRGVNKQPIFNTEIDYRRMLFLLLVFQSSHAFPNLNRHIKRAVQRGGLIMPEEFMKKFLATKAVELISFILMPNHFHLFVFEKEEGGISKYLSRVENAYTKYFNIKYSRSGYLLQGPFQSVHMVTNEQALYLSAYIHRNSRELKEWVNQESSYPWSSYQDYLFQNRWGEFLNTDFILTQFASTDEYRNFVETSGAKEINDLINLPG